MILSAQSNSFPKTGEKYTFQRISHKLRLNRITLAEAYIIADILGYDLEFVERK